MALAIFFLVAANSSSFSIIRRSISCLSWVSSSWMRRTLFSSCSRAPSASESAASSSIFSASRRLQILSMSWIDLPVQELLQLQKVQLQVPFFLLQDACKFYQCHGLIFLFKSSFSFRKCSFKFHFFCFKTLANFINVMDRSSSLTNLIHDVFDFIRQCFVFSSYFIQLKNSFIVG